MIEVYCKAHHKIEEPLCENCAELYDYAMLRLDKCRFRDAKPTCAKCTVHCYKKDMRERVRKVMRYSGPRMLKKHPLLAILHLLDGRRKNKSSK